MLKCHRATKPDGIFVFIHFLMSAAADTQAAVDNWKAVDKSAAGNWVLSAGKQGAADMYIPAYCAC